MSVPVSHIAVDAADLDDAIDDAKTQAAAEAAPVIVCVYQEIYGGQFPMPVRCVEPDETVMVLGGAT